MANERKNQRLWACFALAMGLCFATYALFVAPRAAYATPSIEVVDTGDSTGEPQDTDAPGQGSLQISLSLELPSNISLDDLDLSALQNVLGKSDEWKEALAKLGQKIAEIRSSINVDELKPAAYQAITQALEKSKEAWKQGAQLNAEFIKKATAELNKVWEEVKAKGMRVSIEFATVSGLDDLTYTGKALEPVPTVKLCKKTLVAGTDYDVVYVNNINAGKATAIITGMGDYKGIITCNFTITKAANTLAVKAKTAKVKSSKLNKSNQTLSVSKVLEYTNKGQGKKTFTKKSGNEAITINKKTGKVTVKKGLAKGTYKVKVKVRAKGDANHKSIKKTVKFKIKVV